ncbi:MAG: radical SAM protein, partial [Planctomycetota bacterium]
MKIAAITIGVLLLHPIVAEPVDRLRIPVAETGLDRRLSSVYAIETAAQILSGYATNVVFEYSGTDKRWVLRHSGIEIRLPEQVIQLLSSHMTKAGLDSILLTLRRNSKEDFKKAFMDLEALPHVSISEAFISNGIRVSTQFKKIILVPPYGDADGHPLRFITPHYGVERIAFRLNRECADVDARVYNPNLTSSNELYEFIENENPDIVAFSILYIVLRKSVAMISELHQRVPELKIALGGKDLRYFTDDELFNALPIFACLRDNGDSLISYGNDMAWERIPDVSIRTGDTFKSTKSTELKKDDDSPVDPREDMPLDKIDITHKRGYSKSSSPWKEMLPVERIGHNPLSIDYGDFCKGKCIFCHLRRNTRRPPSAKEILSQLTSYNYKYDSIILESLSFPLGSPESKHLLKEIMSSPFASIPKKITMRADYAGSLTDLQLAKKAGVEISSYGIESFVEEVLQGLKKGITVQQNITALNNSIAAGIRPGINLILFTPWDTITTSDITIQTALDYVEKGAYLNVQDGMDLDPETTLDESMVGYDEISFPGMPSSLRIPSQGEIIDPSLRQLLPRIRKIFYELETDYQPEYVSTASISSLILCKAFYVALIEDGGMNGELFLKIERIDKAIETSIMKMERTDQKGMIKPFLYSGYKYIDIPERNGLSSFRMEEYMASKMPTEIWDTIKKGDAYIELHRGPISRTYAHLQFLRKQGYSINEILPAEARIRKYYKVTNEKETYYIIANNIGNTRELFIAQILYYFSYPA